MELKKNNKIDSNIWKITLINVRIVISPKDYQKSVKQYLEKNCTINNWNLETILQLSPFLFGVSNMIWSRYQDQTVPVIFGQNIPGIKLVKEEMSWQTFKFLKSHDLHLNSIKQIDIYPNSLIFQLKNLDKEKFIGILLPTETINLKTDLHQSLFIKTNGIPKRSIVITDNEILLKKIFFDIQKIFYNLDELPIKLESINKKSKNKNQKTDQSIFRSKVDILTKAKKGLINSNSIPLKTKKNILIPTTFFNKIENPESFYFLKAVLNNQSIVSNQRETFTQENTESIQDQKKDILKNELNNLFYLEGIQPTKLSESLIPRKFLFSFIDHCSIETLKLLGTYVQVKNLDLTFLRSFSGYRFPDLNKEDVYKLVLHSVITNPQNNKIEIPNSFPSLLTKNNLILDGNCYDSLPITSRKDHFLGKERNDEFEFLPKKTSKKEQSPNKIKWKNILISEPYKTEIKPFEDIDDTDLTSKVLQLQEKDISQAVNIEEFLFKNDLEKKSRNTNFYINNTIGKNKKIIYHYPIFAENFLIEKNRTSIKIGDIYKKTANFQVAKNEELNSSRKNNFTFFQIWEPISLNSWMLITQFSFGLFLLRLVKDLYKDYGKELVEYTLESGNPSNIDIEELKEQYLYDETDFRLIRNIKKSFKDVAGIDTILLQLGEIVWLLRNKGRSAKLKTSIPNGILLTGPPGTGKTLLVQALAGEAQVPIIVESGSLLTDPQQKGQGVKRLKKVFDTARQLAPCIIFIDEIDTLGEKRQNIIQTPMGSDELIESIYEKSHHLKENGFIPKPLNLEDEKSNEKDLEYQLFRGEFENSLNKENQTFQQNTEAKKTRLSLLTQFLVEMDGLKQRQGLLVIGATNRPNVLDPALIRPGRLDQIVNLELPGKQKRIEIFKLYGKKLQLANNISWKYLANRTKGFSAADIATAMNESTIQSIINQTTHTVETIERGIELVTSYNSNENNFTNLKKLPDPFFLSRLAYYQAGKAVLTTLLVNHPPLVVLHLVPRPKNARHIHLYENSFSELTNRKEVEAKLIGLYGGKAAEILPLYGNKVSISLKRWQSNLGGDDLVSATFLANLLVDKWYFYSMQVLIRKTNQILNNRNTKEFTEKEKQEISNNFANEIEEEIEIEKIAKLSRIGRYQQRAFGPWWQIQVAKQISEIESFFADWYRIYLPDPEENILNLEWLPPDEYHHTNNYLKKLSKKSSLSFNDLYQIERDYVFHGLLLNSFNIALKILDEKRDYLDYFSDYLLRFNIIRETEIEIIFNTKEQSTNKESKNKNFETSSDDSLKIIDKFWGNTSRRKNSRFLNKLPTSLKTTTKPYISPFIKE